VISTVVKVGGVSSTVPMGDRGMGSLAIVTLSKNIWHVEKDNNKILL
jgi:hypothetical protein